MERVVQNVNMIIFIFINKATRVEMGDTRSEIHIDNLPLILLFGQTARTMTAPKHSKSETV